jgi:alcohol dehydrogenase class IV
VGYVHALAHAMGGFYGTSHGWTNAVLLPYVLKAFGKSAYKELAEISDYLALTGKEANPQTKAAAVIAWVEELNETFGIEKNFAGILKKEDIPALAKHAAKEGNPLYPVPKEMNAKELEKILEEAMG